jgi:hypothetical protein
VTIEFRPHPQKKPSLIEGRIEEIKNKRVDWLKHPTYHDHNGSDESPLTASQVEAALSWAWILQEKHCGTIRIVLDWYGELTPEANTIIQNYPEVSAHYDFANNPDMDGREESRKRKEVMLHEWKQGRKNGSIKRIEDKQSKR